MTFIKGIIVRNGDVVEIGDMYSRQDSYHRIAGEICTYIQQASREGVHYVRHERTGRWVVREVDIYPTKTYTTNKEAKMLLEVDKS